MKKVSKKFENVLKSSKKFGKVVKNSKNVASGSNLTKIVKKKQMEMGEYKNVENILNEQKGLIIQMRFTRLQTN